MPVKVLYIRVVVMITFSGSLSRGEIVSRRHTTQQNEPIGRDMEDGLLRNSLPDNIKSIDDIRSSRYPLVALDKSNPCAFHPCANGGDCFLAQVGFICRCPSGWTGDTCQQRDLTQPAHVIEKRSATKNCTVDPVDVVFVLDSTGSIGSSGFQDELDFVTNFTNLVEIGRDSFHIGVVQFGHNIFYGTVEFDLNQHSDKVSIISAVQNITFQSGGIDYIDVGLKLAKDVLDRTGRSNAVKYVMLLTDGGSRDENATLAIAETLKATYLSLRLYVIGIGLGAPTSHLQHIASDTSYFLSVNQSTGLASVVNSAISTTCRDIKNCSINLCQNGGTCSSASTGYACTCPRGFTGVRCQTVSDINACDPSPCENGGECINVEGSYFCKCSPAWTGKNCSHVFPYWIAVFSLMSVPVIATCLVIAAYVRWRQQIKMNKVTELPSETPSRKTPSTFNGKGGKHGPMLVPRQAPSRT